MHNSIFYGPFLKISILMIFTKITPIVILKKPVIWVILFPNDYGHYEVNNINISENFVRKKN